MTCVGVSWISPARVMALMVMGGIAVQVYLAGLAVFGLPTGWGLHSIFGGLVGLPVLGLAGLAWSASSGKVYRGPASLLVLLYLLQVGLVGAGMGMDNAWISALHPANALAMLLTVAEVLGRTSLSPNSSKKMGLEIALGPNRYEGQKTSRGEQLMRRHWEE